MSSPPPARGIRLQTRVVGGDLPAPPSPFVTWSLESDAVAVWLEADAGMALEVADVAAQLPDPATLRPGETVFVLARASPRARRWSLWSNRRQVPVARATRCAALLVRGYVAIGADAAEELVWGRVPERGDFS